MVDGDQAAHASAPFAARPCAAQHIAPEYGLSGPGAPVGRGGRTGSVARGTAISARPQRRPAGRCTRAARTGCASCNLESREVVDPRIHSHGDMMGSENTVPPRARRIHERCCSGSREKNHAHGDRSWLARPLCRATTLYHRGRCTPISAFFAPIGVHLQTRIQF